MQIDIWQIVKSSFSILLDFWPIWVTFLLLIGIRIGLDQLGYEFDSWIIRRKFRQGEKWRSGREMIAWLRQMNPSEFEKYIADIFQRLGYSAKATGGAYDHGIDVVAEKRGIKYYIQCKRYSVKNRVGVGAVRDFYGALADHVANGKGYFITTGEFTLEAERFADDKPIELIDSHRLLDYIRLSNGEDASRAAMVSLLKCPRCNGELVEREGKYGKFHGCSNFPKCKYTAK